MSKLGSAASGAVGGAAAGSVLGPWGAAGGAIIGGIGGWLSGSDGPSDAELAQQAKQQAARDEATNLAAQAARGGGPTAAQALLNRNVTNANDLAFSQAKGIAGANSALAATLASNQSSANSMDAIQQAAALRAQEQQAGLQQYLAATGVNTATAFANDQAQTAQENLQSAHNQQLFNSAIGGAANAAGRIAAAQNAGAKPAANAVSNPTADPTSPQYDPNTDPTYGHRQTY